VKTSSYTIIVLLILGIIGYVINQKQQHNPVQEVQVEDVQKDFEILVGKTYALAKQELSAKGWVAYEPKVDDSALGEPWVSAGDTTYPEIGWCGQGLDAICNVNFKKDGQERHLNVQINGRLSDGQYKEWIVVGSE
jgi:hypothetical protein